MRFIDDILKEILSPNCKLNCISSVTDQQIYEVIQNAGIKSQDLVIVLEEIYENSREHGGEPIKFYFDKNFDEFVFAIQDFGIGIHATLPQNKKLSDLKGKSSSSLLRLSLEEGITGTGKVGRGMGLYLLSQLILDKRAELIIASDSGFVYQKVNVFFEYTMQEDIKCNIVLLTIKQSELGL